MTPNFAPKIVHSSAMYYPNLIIIHECSKKLFKMKNSKSFFKHLVYTYFLALYYGKSVETSFLRVNCSFLLNGVESSMYLFVRCRSIDVCQDCSVLL